LLPRRLVAILPDSPAVISPINRSHYVIPANHEWYHNYLVAKIIVAALNKMDPQYPPAPEGVDFRKVKIPV
jgi:hypothetical protein